MGQLYNITQTTILYEGRVNYMDNHYPLQLRPYVKLLTNSKEKSGKQINFREARRPHL